ncbi:glycosyltransferase family 4 protein [Euzebya tangerina]|uniref:glycosyltransferase family 4 protein n=1 Tax=Euzebya tangerina TaxID=591198 RepID=UPI00196A4A76|nr:glycosyltransferase family 4 protein [Euzebya tangerina]
MTNDFPPRSGGIEQMVSHLVGTLPPDSVMVLASPWQGATEHDRALPYPVRRVHRRPLLPTPALLRTVRAAASDHQADVVVFGSAWPLAELAGRLDLPTLGITHGREAGMARYGLAPLMRRLARGCTAMTVLSDYTAGLLAPVLDRLTDLHRLPGGVDTQTFTPDGPDLREQHGLEPDQPVVVCISRLVRRKGQDVLIEQWPRVRAAVADAHLLIVGTGPLEEELTDRVAELGLGDAVTLTGEVPWADLPAYYRTGDAFAMPCRTRLLGTDVEGLGLVFLEAQACGVPVVVGDSGGAPQTVVQGETGVVVDGHDPDSVYAAVVGLLSDPGRLRTMGEAGTEFVRRQWEWSVIGQRLLRAIQAAARGGA